MNLSRLNARCVRGPSLGVLALCVTVALLVQFVWVFNDAGLSGTIHFLKVSENPELGADARALLGQSWATEIRCVICLATVICTGIPLGLLLFRRRATDGVVESRRRFVCVNLISAAPVISIVGLIYFHYNVLERCHRARVSAFATRIERLCDRLVVEWPLMGVRDLEGWRIVASEKDGVVWVLNGNMILGWREDIGYSIERCGESFIVQMASISSKGETRFVVIDGPIPNEKQEVVVCDMRFPRADWVPISKRALLAKTIVAIGNGDPEREGDGTL